MPAMKVTPEQFAQHMTSVHVPKRKSFGDWYATFIFLVLTPGIVAVFLLGVALFSAPLLLVVAYTSARLPRPRRSRASRATRASTSSRTWYCCRSRCP